MQAIKDVSSGTPEAMQDLPLDSVAAVSTNEVPNQVSMV